jgi:dipeptidyl aminopeptidase/acylaminoacyl peptidase
MTEGKTMRQFGLWRSPVTSAYLARSISLNDVAWGEDGTLVWLEQRSDRGVLVLNCELSVRAKVGYGGGDFCVGRGYVYFTEAESGRIYRQPIVAGDAKPVTPGFGSFASPTLSPNGHWLLFVHSYEGRDSLGLMDSEGKNWPIRLVSDHDFYMQPCWHPQKDQIAWIDWNFPNMPWDGTYLHLGKLRLPERQDNTLPVLDEVSTIAGGEETSIFQPQFSPDGHSLAYVSDRTGWWQIYLYDLNTGEHRQLTDIPAEFGLPAWVQGLRTYAFDNSEKNIFALQYMEGINSVWRISLSDVAKGKARIERLPLDEAYTGLSQIAVSPNSNRIALIASGANIPPRLITFESDGSVHIWRRGTTEELNTELYPDTQGLTWKGMDGGKVHGIYYPPNNPGFSSAGKPPLIVSIHGGPTGHVSAAFNPRALFFTSRGYAYLEVNYRGSTGYGRDYRNALRQSWGIYDVQDAVSGAKDLANRGLVDGTRMMIMGGSAGGFTVLKALEDYPGVFKAGICLYGVSNQFNLAAETHKFEAHYLDSLLGPLPEASQLYKERSPIFFADRIQDPIAIFQGEIDQVVPRSQSDTVVESLKRRGIPHEYHIYPGEGHGFRRTETIIDYYNAVEKFLKQYVIFA